MLAEGTACSSPASTGPSGVASYERGGYDTVVLGLAAFALMTFWKWRLMVGAVVLGGGMLGLGRALGGF